MNKNIIVVGANQTGLVFAAFAKTAGFDVTVYEAKNNATSRTTGPTIWLKKPLKKSACPFPQRRFTREKETGRSCRPKKA